MTAEAYRFRYQLDEHISMCLCVCLCRGLDADECACVEDVQEGIVNALLAKGLVQVREQRIYHERGSTRPT